jgi:integrase
MALYRRRDSPYWWLCLERPGLDPIRVSSRIPIDGGTSEQTKRNRELAQQAYAAKMGDLARDRFQLPKDRPTIPFATYRDWYATHITTTKRSQLSERSILKQLGAYFDPSQLAQITTRDVIEWRTARASEVAPASVNREFQVLRHLLGSAIPKYLEGNPAAGVKQLRVPEQDVRLLEPHEEATLLALCTSVERAIVLCALDTLQRLTNVASLQRAQDHGTHLTVLNPKVKGYKVPVSARLRVALDALPKDGPFYFPSLQGGTNVARRKRVIDLFTALLVKAKLPTGRKAGGLSFHCLRHTGASRMLARGVDVKTVAQIGGWADISILQRYLHPTDAQRKAAVETVAS